MAERDRFELDLAASLCAYAEDAPTQVRPTELARHFASAYPHRGTRFGRWSFGLTPAVAWLLILTGLLLALVVGGLMVGAWRPDRAAVIAPSPTPVATVAPSPTPAATATTDLPPGELTPHKAAELGVPVVTPSELGQISWTVWWPARSPNPIPLDTPHGPVLLQGENLIWRSSSGPWKASPILGTARWPGAALGDDLVLTDGGRLGARFHWTGSDWVAAGRLEGLDAFSLTGLVAGPHGTIAFGTAGVASSSDGIRFVPAPGGPDCVASVVAKGDQLVALSGPCGKGAAFTVAGIDASSLAQRFDEPIPWTSTDGLGWQPAATTSPFGSGSTIFGVASRGGRQVAIGVAPPVGGGPAATSALESAVWVSDDGLAWRRLPKLSEAPTIPDVDGSPTIGVGFRTIVANDAGWLILAFDSSSMAWTSADGLAWKPLHGQPWVSGGYLPPVVALSSDLILAAGIGHDRVAIGTILRP
jgi:hypothetical protein